MKSKTPLSIASFDYHLPDELIAQRPAGQRSDSRLLCLDRKTGTTDHRYFRDLPEILREGDLLVLNDTRVFPARLMARRESGGAVEVFLLQYPVEGTSTPCLVKPGRRIRDRERFILDDGHALIVMRTAEGFSVSAENIGLAEVMKKHGQVPLPPYIRRGEGGPDADDRERYQTVYASRPGAVAAPTAGLHFDGDILDLLGSRGVETGRVTLHVGPGTFVPVKTTDITAHTMETERYDVPDQTAVQVKQARARGSRVVAVGTTVVRTLESAFDGMTLRAGVGESGLFIYPGYSFSVVDALLTNFHLPRSTLLMLVCAFAGTEMTLEAYQEAVEKKYRFYSYGDAMFIE